MCEAPQLHRENNWFPSEKESKCWSAVGAKKDMGWAQGGANVR